jgi:hypothetical protein
MVGSCDLLSIFAVAWIFYNGRIMRRVLIIASSLILLSCAKGVWINQNVYRPKKASYSILRTGLKQDSLIDGRVLYVSTRKFISYNGEVITGYMGFYQDGRLIVDNIIEKDGIQITPTRNTFETAGYAGYYTTEAGRITVQYFVPTDGGQYLEREGTIRKDTVTLIERRRTPPFKLEQRYDTLVKSSIPLK